MYVHVPFCSTRCGYCDFAAFEGMDDLIPDYVDAVVEEIGSRVPVEASTVFVGGGTPSILPPEQLAGLIGSVPRRQGAEVTVEMNPESATVEILEAARGAGATRVSMGMQSALPHVLGYLDRAHRHNTLESAVRRARRVGFEHINVDLIYASPVESDADWRRTLECTVALGPDHVSAYALGIEPATPLGVEVASGAKEGPDDDVAARRLEMAVEALASAGYVRYEISNWAQAVPCVHNLRYWSLGSYVGVGSGAHSYVPSSGSDPEPIDPRAGGLRTWNHRHPRRYISAMRQDGVAVAGGERVAGDAALLEWLSLGLRRSCGVELSTEELGHVPEVLFEAGLVEVGPSNGGSDSGPPEMHKGRLALTTKGMSLANAVVTDLSLAFGDC